MAWGNREDPCKFQSRVANLLLSCGLIWTTIEDLTCCGQVLAGVLTSISSVGQFSVFIVKNARVYRNAVGEVIRDEREGPGWGQWLGVRNSYITQQTRLCRASAGPCKCRTMQAHASTCISETLRTMMMQSTSSPLDDAIQLSFGFTTLSSIPSDGTIELTLGDLTLIPLYETYDESLLPDGMILITHMFMCIICTARWDDLAPIVLPTRMISVPLDPLPHTVCPTPGTEATGQGARSVLQGYQPSVLSLRAWCFPAQLRLLLCSAILLRSSCSCMSQTIFLHSIVSIDNAPSCYGT